MNQASIPMTEINQILSGKEGSMHLKKMSDKLDIDIQQISQKMKLGLPPDEYQQKAIHLRALQVAKQVLNSLHIYHNQ